MYTLPDYHPGKNRLGHLTMELRTSICQDTTSHENHVPSTPMTSLVLSAPNSPVKTNPNNVDLKSESPTAKNSKVKNSDKKNNKDDTNVSQPSNKKGQETADRSRSKIINCSIDRFVIKMSDRSLSKDRRLTEENDHYQLTITN